jgi:hypothetical protein
VYIIDAMDSSDPGDHTGRLAAARAALQDACRVVAATGEPVKVESEILRGRPLTKLMEESRSAAMICVGSIGLNHACRGGGSTAAALAGSAVCPVAVVRRPLGRQATPRVSSVVAQVDNGMVLRHAFEEARLRGATLRAISVSRAEALRDGSDADDGLAQAQMNRRLARWTRLYPDVPVESVVVKGSVDEYLTANDEADQVFVTDSHTCEGLCGAYNAGRSVLAIRCSHL